MSKEKRRLTAAQIKSIEREHKKRQRGEEKYASVNSSQSRNECLNPNVKLIVEEARKRGIHESESKMRLWKGSDIRPRPDPGPYDLFTNYKAKSLHEKYLAIFLRSENPVAKTNAEFYIEATGDRHGSPFLETDFYFSGSTRQAILMKMSFPVRKNGDFSGKLSIFSPTTVNLSGVEHGAVFVHEMDHARECLELVQGKESLTRQEKLELVTQEFGMDISYDATVRREARAFAVTGEYLIHQYGLGFRGPMLDTHLLVASKYIQAGATSSDRWIEVVAAEIVTPQLYSQMNERLRN